MCRSGVCRSRRACGSAYVSIVIRRHRIRRHRMRRPWRTSVKPDTPALTVHRRLPEAVAIQGLHTAPSKAFPVRVLPMSDSARARSCQAAQLARGGAANHDSLPVPVGSQAAGGLNRAGPLTLMPADMRHISCYDEAWAPLRHVSPASLRRPQACAADVLRPHDVPQRRREPFFRHEGYARRPAREQAEARIRGACRRGCSLCVSDIRPHRRRHVSHAPRPLCRAAGADIITRSAHEGERT